MTGAAISFDCCSGHEIRVVAAALLLAGCHGARTPWEIASVMKPGMTLPAVESELRKRDYDVQVSPAHDLHVYASDRSQAVVVFRPEGQWRYVSVTSPLLSRADASMLLERFGPPTSARRAVIAVWPNQTEFRSYDDRTGTPRSTEARSGRSGAVGIGPAGLQWGMSPAEVRLVLEGVPGIDEPAEELEFEGEHDALLGDFDDGHLTHVAYSVSPPLDGAAASSRLAALEKELGPADRVLDIEVRAWPARHTTVSITHARGEARVKVDQVTTDR